MLTATGAVILSLLLPVWYRAETRVMLPQTSGGGMTALIESVAPGASTLLGGDGGDYTRYLAILTSRTVNERVVEHFNLVERYETVDHVDPVGAALDELGSNISLEVNIEYNFLSVGVLDRDPRAAAVIANYYVEQLNAENTRLSSESAREQRKFVETRLREAELALDSVRADMQALQERYGITQPDAQGEAVLAAIGAATAAVAETDVRYQAMRSELGDENPQTVAALAALETARRQMAGLQGGESALLPIPLRTLPQVGREYSRLMQEMMLQAEIIKFIRPMYEQASYDERSNMSAVQVIDPAKPPVRKAKPKRAVLVLALTASTMTLFALLLILMAALRRHGSAISAQMQRYAA